MRSVFASLRAGGGPSLKAAQSTVLTTAVQGDVVSSLSQPFGSGTTFQTVGTVPGQLALSGSSILRGASAPVVGQQYSIKIRALSADGKRETAETLVFIASYPPAGPVMTLGGLPLPNATVGQAYSYQLIISGGVPPFSSQVVDGDRPLSVNISGRTMTVAGTPEAA